jgi:hypothetical protein
LQTSALPLGDAAANRYCCMTDYSDFNIDSHKNFLLL